MYRRMQMIRLFEERVNDLYTRALMPGPGASLHRRRSHRRRHLRGAPQGRLHHQHAPRPRPLPGQGRVARPDVCRAARQGSGLLQGQGRLDAHRRPGHRQPGRQCDRRRQRRHRHRRRVFGQVRWRPTGRRLLLRRRRAGTGRALRRDEPGALWKLPVIYVCENNLYNEYTHFSETTAGESWREALRSALPPKPSTDRTCARFTPSRQARRARAPGEGPAFFCATPTAITAITSATSTATTTGQTEEQEWKTERDPIKLLRTG